MSTKNQFFEPTFTSFFLVKTAPEWLNFTIDERIAHGRSTLQPLLEDFAQSVSLTWYDTEFYTATITDIWMIEAKDNASYQLFCEKLRETPFWDRFFIVKEIFIGEKNAWAKNYNIAPLS